LRARANERSGSPRNYREGETAKREFGILLDFDGGHGLS
jgi:hypothetical protein